MQRQSLGSPVPKLHSISGDIADAAAPSADDIKSTKPNRSPPRTVHLIPLLVFVCFLLLYAISHEPSPFDLPSTPGIERFIDKNAGSVSAFAAAAVRTKRGLMEEKAEIDRLIRSRRLGIPRGT